MILLVISNKDMDVLKQLVLQSVETSSSLGTNVKTTTLSQGTDVPQLVRSNRATLAKAILLRPARPHVLTRLKAGRKNVTMGT